MAERGCDMKGKMCNTANGQCPAFDDRFRDGYCSLGFPIEVAERKKVSGIEMRYYRCCGECTKPKSMREYIKMKLG